MTMTNKIARKGFTLIELLVVMSIMGILMALIIPKVGRLLDNAKEQKCRNTLKQLQAAVMNFMNDNKNEKHEYGRLPFAMSFEVFDPPSQTYHERRGWICWTKKEWSYDDSGDIDEHDELWEGDNAEKSHAEELENDLGTGRSAVWGIKRGTLFPYVNSSLAPYTCPVMKSERERLDITPSGYSVYRTYAMNPFFYSPEYKSWWERKATGIGSSETYKQGEGDITHKPEPSKLLLFCEVFPSVGENDTEKSGSSDPRNRGACAIRPLDKTLKNPDKNEFIAYDTNSKTYGIHNRSIKNSKTSLAVFFDGHIETIYSIVRNETEDGDVNAAWYLVRGLDPKL